MGIHEVEKSNEHRREKERAKVSVNNGQYKRLDQLRKFPQKE